jgi:hypothetical protein
MLLPQSLQSSPSSLNLSQLNPSPPHPRPHLSSFLNLPLHLQSLRLPQSLRLLRPLRLLQPLLHLLLHRLPLFLPSHPRLPLFLSPHPQQPRSRRTPCRRQRQQQRARPVTSLRSCASWRMSTAST